MVPLVLAETNDDAGITSNVFYWTGTSSGVWNGNVNNWNPNPSAVANSPGMGTNVDATVIIPQMSNQPTATSLNLSLTDITIGSGAILTMATGGTLTVKGNFYNYNFNGNSNGFTAVAAHTTTYTGTSKLIAPGNYGNLTFSGATTPILSPVGTIAVKGTFTPVNSGVTYTGSTIGFNGTTTQTIPAFDFFNNVLFNNTAAANSITFSGKVTVYGDMTINCPEFTDGGREIVGAGTGKTLSMLAGRSYTATYTGAKAIPDFDTYNVYGINGNTTMRFNAAITTAQTIPAAEYGAVAINNGGMNAKSLAGNTTIRGLLNVASGGLSIGNNTLTCFQGITNNAVTATNASIITGASGKILLAGGVASPSDCHYRYRYS